MSLVVHKFGGVLFTESCEGYETAREVLSSPRGSSTPGSVISHVAVISAMLGVTDHLSSAVLKASQGDPSYAELVEKVVAQQITTTKKLLAGESAEAVRGELVGRLERDLQDMLSVLKAIFLTGSIATELADPVIAYGELWNTALVTAVLNGSGLKAVQLDSRDVLVVESDAASEFPTVNWQLTQERFSKFVEQIKAETPVILVITGYIARTMNGVTTTLKRKGSDFTASIFGALLKASEIILWSNINGIYSADPDKVPSAQLLPELTYSEVMEFSFYGDNSMVHPRTIQPALTSLIPIQVRNAFNLACPGTKIHQGDITHVDFSKLAPQDAIRGLVEKHHIALVKIVGAPVTIGENTPLNNRNTLMMRLRSENVSVSMVLHAAPENTLTLAVNEDKAEATKQIIEEIFAKEFGARQILRVDVASGFAILTAIGDYISQVGGVASIFFSALQRHAINVFSVAQNGERIISVVIKQSDADGAFRYVHSAFKNPMDTISIGIIGAGNLPVTSKLLARIQAHQALRETEPQRHNFEVVAVSDLKNMLLDVSLSPRKLSDEAALRTSLEVDGKPHDLDQLLIHLDAQAGYHRVIVDCCDGHKETARQYPEWLSKGFHVVTTNLGIFASDSDLFASITRAQELSHSEFLFSEAVTPGFPLSKHLSSILGMKGTVLSVEALLTSSFNPLFLNLDQEGANFATLATKYAPTLSRFYSGDYTARKLCVLAKICGFPTTLSDIDIERLVQRDLTFEGGVCNNPERLKAETAFVDQKIKATKKQNRVVRYIASFDKEGLGKVALKDFEKDHPIARAGEDDVVLVIQTDLDDEPMVICCQDKPNEGLGLYSDLVSLGHLFRS